MAEPAPGGKTPVVVTGRDSAAIVIHGPVSVAT